MFNVALSLEDAEFLTAQLALQIAHVEAELVRTDRRSMQRDLAKDLERLQAIRQRIESARLAFAA
jgi:hypothetical protein